jgi:hypothetical protein
VILTREELGEAVRPFTVDATRTHEQAQALFIALRTRDAAVILEGYRRLRVAAKETAASAAALAALLEKSEWIEGQVE